MKILIIWLLSMSFIFSFDYHRDTSMNIEQIDYNEEMEQYFNNLINNTQYTNNAMEITPNSTLTHAFGAGSARVLGNITAFLNQQIGFMSQDTLNEFRISIEERDRSFSTAMDMETIWDLGIWGGTKKSLSMTPHWLASSAPEMVVDTAMFLALSAATGGIGILVGSLVNFGVIIVILPGKNANMFAMDRFMGLKAQGIIDYTALTPTQNDYFLGSLIVAIPLALFALWWLVSMFFKNNDDGGGVQ